MTTALTVEAAAKKIAAEINAAGLGCEAEYCPLNEEVTLTAQGREIGTIRAVERTQRIDGGKRYLGVFDFAAFTTTYWEGRVEIFCLDVMAAKAAPAVAVEPVAVQDEETLATARAVEVANELAAAGMKRGTRLIDRIRTVLAKEFPAIEQWKRVNIACNADATLVSTRKPFSQYAGYIASLRSAGNKGWVVIYDSAAQQLDSAAGKYVCTCEQHGQTSYHSSLPKARVELKDPTIFCVYCRYEKEEGLKPEDYDQVVADQKEVIAVRGF